MNIRLKVLTKTRIFKEKKAHYQCIQGFVKKKKQLMLLKG